MKIYSTKHVVKQSYPFPSTDTDMFSKQYGAKLNTIFEQFCDACGTSKYQIFWRKATANKTRYYRPIIFVPLDVRKEDGRGVFILIHRTWTSSLTDGHTASNLDEKFRRHWLSSAINVSVPLEKIPPHDCEDFRFQAPVGYPYTTKTDIAHVLTTLNEGW